MALPLLALNGLGLANPYVGQGVVALRIVEGLQRRGLPFKVLAPPDFHALRDLLQPGEFEPVETRPPHGHELLAHPWRMQAVARHVCRHFPDALFHSASPFWSWSLPRVRVVTLHDCIYRTFRAYLGRFWLRRVQVEATERWAARGQLVLTDSHFSAAELAEKAGVPAERIAVLYPWVDDRSRAAVEPADLAALRARLGLPERFWLYVGGYDYRKNVEVLIRAHARLLAGGVAVPPLALAGRLPPEPRTEVWCDVRATLREVGRPEMYLLPGLIDHADLPNLYRAAELLVYPSRMEGFGLPPAEAMAVGTPVLVADNSSLPEVVRRPECRFAGSDEAALAERLRAACADPAAFHCPLPDEFTEAVGLPRYLELLEQALRTK